MPKIEFLKQSFCYNGAKLWNYIPDEIRSSISLASFCSKLSPRPLIFDLFFLVYVCIISNYFNLICNILHVISHLFCKSAFAEKN